MLFRSALFSTTLLDALVSEDTPILETSLSGLVEIHPNLLGAEFCNYQNHPLLRWGENVPECHPDAVVKGLDQNLILTTYREVIFEGERFGAIALRWDLVESFKNLEQQVQQITTMLVFAVLLLALVLFILVHLLVVRPIRKVDDYLHSITSGNIGKQVVGDDRGHVKTIIKLLAANNADYAPTQVALAA